MTDTNPITTGHTVSGNLATLVSDKPLPPPSKFRADLSPEVDLFMARMLAKQPADRFQFARQARAAFRVAMGVPSP